MAEKTVLDSLASVGLLILSLEFGYFTGLLSTDIFAAAHRLSEFRPPEVGLNLANYLGRREIKS